MAVSNVDIHHRQANGELKRPSDTSSNASPSSTSGSGQTAGTFGLIIGVGGIYASFLTWGVLQERITTTNYNTDPVSSQREVFKYPVVMNTVQSTFAAILGYIYILATRTSSNPLPVFPSQKIIWPLTLVALTSALSSPFGYASLAHVDYITFILAKSCKLLPVMLLHITLYGKRYPFYKYAVVALVTAGVAVFTLHQSSGSSGKKKSKGAESSSLYGLMLLSINLLFDGLTNSTQDDIYAKFKPYSGQQMMCALNLMSTALTTGYLFLSPYLASTGVGAYVGMGVASKAGELQGALAFIQRHPSVGWDILGFAAAGAIGQVFIFYTLARFGSLLLVTVTVTRKMLTMILSVVWFGHSLTPMQWVGVGLVFGGIGVESQLSRKEKLAKEATRKKQ